MHGKNRMFAKSQRADGLALVLGAGVASKRADVVWH